MKKLLLIQQDDEYFLYETLLVLDKNRSFLREFDTTLLINQKAASAFTNGPLLFKEVTTNQDQILENKFDISVNLSLNESSWTFHGQVQSKHKIGPHIQNGELIINDIWSSYLLTLKEKSSFLPFHLQDVYSNILGFKKNLSKKINYSQINHIVIGTSAGHFFSPEEQEKFIELLAYHFHGIPISDISEIELEKDHNGSIYIGPCTLSSRQLCERGARGYFLASGFYGHNLFPYNGDHKLISSGGKKLDAEKLTMIILNLLREKKQLNFDYSIYSTDHETFNGLFFTANGIPETNYIFYQSYVILWQFLLNLADINLGPLICKKEVLHQINSQIVILEKLIRLYDYAMVSIDDIHQSSKNKNADPYLINGHLKNLKEIETITEGVSRSNSFIRPLINFYRIRRSQNFGQSLLEQSQNSFLNYAEEHQALKAMHELLLSTLNKNEYFSTDADHWNNMEIKLK